MIHEKNRMVLCQESGEGKRFTSDLVNELVQTRRFADRLGARVRVTTRSAWLLWSGTHWELDRKQQGKRRPARTGARQ